MIKEILFGNSSCYKLILFLGKKDLIYTTDIMREMRLSTNSISRGLKNLKEIGVVEYLTLENKLKKYWRLTEKGKKVYNLLIKLEELINEMWKYQKLQILQKKNEKNWN